MSKLFVYILFFFIISCNNLEFVYNDSDNILNPLYGKTDVKISGLSSVYLSSYSQLFFGSNDKKIYKLNINIEEEKTKRSVEKNQAASNIRYELRFFYNLFSYEKDCVINSKEIVSKFSVTPKSSGYNYGTDASLEKEYEIAINQNINKYVSSLVNINLTKCK